MFYSPNQTCYFWLRAMLFVVLLVACTSNPVPDVPVDTALPSPTEPSPMQNQIRQRIALPQSAGAVAFGDGSIWVVNRTEHHVLRIDMETGSAVGSPITLGFEPREIAY